MTADSAIGSDLASLPKVDVHIVIVVFRNAKEDVNLLVRHLLLATRNAGRTACATLVFNDDQTMEPSSDVNVVAGHGNVGFAKGVSLGLASVASRFALVVNPDCVADAASVGRFLAKLRPGCGILVPILEKRQGEVDATIYENWVFTPTRKISHLVCRVVLRGRGTTRLPRLMKAPGTFIGMESAVARYLDGPFDRSFYLYGEDRDMTMRARRANIDISVVRDSRVLHPGGGSSEGMSDFVERAKADSMLRIAFRRYGRLGFEMMAANMLVEGAVKDLLRRSRLLLSRREAISRWRRSLPAPARALRAEDLRDLSASGSLESGAR